MLNNTKEKMMDMSFPGMGSMLSKAGIDSHVIDAKKQPQHSRQEAGFTEGKRREHELDQILY